ncbi:1577_t:CDS:1, partial [Acaulospora morrowiae]
MNNEEINDSSSFTTNSIVDPLICSFNNIHETSSFISETSTLSAESFNNRKRTHENDRSYVWKYYEKKEVIKDGKTELQAYYKLNMPD